MYKQYLHYLVGALLWAKKGLEWKGVRLEDIVNVGLTAGVISGPKTVPAQARLWRILITESAHLIWRLRCERVIGHDEDTNWEHTAKAVAAKWRRVMDSRLRQDVTATSPRFGRLAVDAKLVRDTWRDLVPTQKSASAQGQWTRSIDRVLVGIDPDVVAIEPNG